MFNQDFIQKLLYLDVETVSLYKNLLDLEAKNPRAHSLWKKRESYLCAYITARGARWQKRF